MLRKVSPAYTLSASRLSTEEKKMHCRLLELQLLAHINVNKNYYVLNPLVDCSSRTLDRIVCLSACHLSCLSEHAAKGSHFTLS